MVLSRAAARTAQAVQFQSPPRSTLFVPSVAESTGDTSPASIAAEVRELMQKESLAEKDALKRVARARGMAKSEAYRELQRNRSK